MKPTEKSGFMVRARLKNIFKRFIPENTRFFDLLETHVSLLKKAVPLIREIIGTRKVHPEIKLMIIDLEHECDSVAKELHILLDGTFITPRDREDIYDLIVDLDNIMDLIEDVVVWIVDYDIADHNDLLKFLGLLCDAIDYLYEGVMCIRNLKDLGDLREKMTDCEHQADDLFRNIFLSIHAVRVADILGSRRVTPMDTLGFIKGTIPPEQALDSRSAAEPRGIKPFVPPSRSGNVRLRTFPAPLGVIKNRDNAPVSALDVQKILDELSFRQRLMMIIQDLEDAVDTCKNVFHVLERLRLKYS